MQVQEDEPLDDDALCRMECELRAECEYYIIQKNGACILYKQLNIITPDKSEPQRALTYYECKNILIL